MGEVHLLLKLESELELELELELVVWRENKIDDGSDVGLGVIVMSWNEDILLKCDVIYRRLLSRNR